MAISPRTPGFLAAGSVRYTPLEIVPAARQDGTRYRGGESIGETSRMSYPPAFLDIQVTFARRLAELTRQPFHESVLHNTALYRILGLDWSLDQHHPVWCSFIAALREDGTGFEAA